MYFTKVHGLGNDFVLIDGFSQDLPADPAPLARKLCDRRFGVGADGLVLILPSESAHLRIRVFNPDGSEPEMCGNAIRCVALYAHRRGVVSQKRIEVETPAGIIRPEILSAAGEETVRVDMGRPRLERAEIPMAGPAGPVVGEQLKAGNRDFEVTAVSMGNPHCVIFDADLDEQEFQRYGPLLERHPVFPARTNVEFVTVRNPGEADVWVWERGAGATPACGTGACAVAVAGVLNGRTGRTVNVRLPGGVLLIEWPDDAGSVYMTGPAEEVFDGKLL
ncbi:MAG: diaminopimelate epimerase [Candidatus Desulforudis sp.]|nr:diaminopimelate epimerase [Desulforudis sp.]